MSTASQPTTPLEPLAQTDKLLPLLIQENAESTCCGGSCSFG